MVAVANNFGGFYRTEFYLHEAKRAGATVEAPCVNRSEELCALNGPRRNGELRIKNEECRTRTYEDPAVADRSENTRSVDNSTFSILHSEFREAARIYLGLENVKSLNSETVQLILIERRRNGPFRDLQDLIRRVPLHVEQARILIRVGALRFTGRSKPALLWDLTLLHRGPSNASTDGDLFVTKVEAPKLPDLHHYPLADAYDELELLGFPLRDPFTMVECGSDDQMIRRSEDGGVVVSPFPIVGRDGRLMGKTAGTTHAVQMADERSSFLASQMPTHVGKRVTMLGYMIHVKTTTTNSGSYMSFGSFIDQAGDFWDSTQFPSVAERYPFRGRGVYQLTGVVEEEFGHCALRTERMEKLPWKPDPRYGE
jgi:DNA polymerase-3 subunit alpha